MTIDAIRRTATLLSIRDLIGAVSEGTSAFAAALQGMDEHASAEIKGTARGGVSLGISIAREVLHVALTGELPAAEDSPDLVGPGDLASAYSQAIESCIAHVEAADADAFLDVTWVHPAYGPMNWREWFAFLGYDARARVDGISGGR